MPRLTRAWVLSLSLSLLPSSSPLSTSTTPPELSPRQRAALPVVNSLVSRIRVNAERNDEAELTELAKGYSRNKIVAYGNRRPAAVAWRLACQAARREQLLARGACAGPWYGRRKWCARRRRERRRCSRLRLG